MALYRRVEPKPVMWASDSSGRRISCKFVVGRPEKMPDRPAQVARRRRRRKSFVATLSPSGTPAAMRGMIQLRAALHCALVKGPEPGMEREEDVRKKAAGPIQARLLGA